MRCLRKSLHMLAFHFLLRASTAACTGASRRRVDAKRALLALGGVPAHRHLQARRTYLYSRAAKGNAQHSRFPASPDR